MWKNQNPRVLLVEILNGPAAVENSVAVPQNVKNSVNTWPSISLLPIYPGEMKTYVHMKTVHKWS